MNKVFVKNLPFRLSPEDIIEYFSINAGDIVDISFPCNKIHRTNNGCCYIIFKDDVSESNALKLNGQCILGQPIYIQKAKSPSSASTNADTFLRKFNTPTRRFQTIRQPLPQNKYCLEEKSQRFKGGYLLSEDFKNYCKAEKIKAITKKDTPLFPNVLNSLYYYSHASH